MVIVVAFYNILRFVSLSSSLLGSMPFVYDITSHGRIPHAHNGVVKVEAAIHATMSESAFTWFHVVNFAEFRFGKKGATPMIRRVCDVIFFLVLGSSWYENISVMCDDVTVVCMLPPLNDETVCKSRTY